MKYIVCKACSCKFLGKTNELRKGNSCNEENGIIYHNSTPICYKTSQNAYDYFARNDDGQGQARFKVITNILDTIKEMVATYNDSYMAIVSTFTEETTEEEKEIALSSLENPVVESYERIKETYPTFLKNDGHTFTFDFYNATKEELENVLELCH